jgi:hypothetical protein
MSILTQGLAEDIVGDASAATCMEYHDSMVVGENMRKEYSDPTKKFLIWLKLGKLFFVMVT